MVGGEDWLAGGTQGEMLLDGAEQFVVDPDASAVDDVDVEDWLVRYIPEVEIGSIRDDDADAFWSSGEMISSVTVEGHVSSFFRGGM